MVNYRLQHARNHRVSARIRVWARVRAMARVRIIPAVFLPAKYWNKLSQSVVQASTLDVCCHLSPPHLHLTTSKVMAIVWRLRGILS